MIGSLIDKMRDLGIRMELTGMANYGYIQTATRSKMIFLQRLGRQKMISSGSSRIMLQEIVGAIFLRPSPNQIMYYHLLNGDCG